MEEERERERERQRDRETERQRDRETERQRERESGRDCVSETDSKVSLGVSVVSLFPDFETTKQVRGCGNSGLCRRESDINSLRTFLKDIGDSDGTVETVEFGPRSRGGELSILAKARGAYIYLLGRETKQVWPDSRHPGECRALLRPQLGGRM